MSKLLWVDLETTGLNPMLDEVLEVAAVVTDENLNALADFSRVVHPIKLPNMDPVVISMHTKNGLLKEVEQTGDLIEVVEDMFAEFVTTYFPDGYRPPLAGSTVSFDRAFIIEHMSKVISKIHYRNVDVSSVKELCARWRPELLTEWKQSQKESKHRALPDIYQSIEELRFYKERFFK